MKTHLSLIFLSCCSHPLFMHNREILDHIQLKLGLIILNLIILIHKTRKILQTIIRGDLPMMFFINLL